MQPHRRKPTVGSLLAILCVLILLPGDSIALVAQSPPAASPSNAQGAAPASTPIPPEQLDSLVAPVALYPDPLLAQVFAAATYPLEMIQLHQWLGKNKQLRDKELADAAAKQPWDASIQALAGLPDVVKRLADDIQWTTDLGNAFLAQQTDVMDAVQRMRQKAQDKGTLKTTEQQKVEKKVVENKSVIVIEQANPQVVYVPSYDPVVVYGPAYYPYPPIYYPPAGYYVAGMAISFGVGVAMGAFWGGGWGWGCGWGHNDVYINHNNNFTRNSNIDRGNTSIGSGNRVSTQPARGGGDRSTWSHNPDHRGGAPYRDRGTADRFGGTARGDSLAKRQSGARQQISRQGGSFGGGSRGIAGGAGDSFAGRGGGGAGVSDRSRGSGVGGGADRIGSKDLSRSGGGNRDAFGGGSRGFDGSSARSSSSRGMSSMSSRGGGGGGFSRGGGGGRRR